jgi:hypothetical protein
VGLESAAVRVLELELAGLAEVALGPEAALARAELELAAGLKHLVSG